MDNDTKMPDRLGSKFHDLSISTDQSKSPDPPTVPPTRPQIPTRGGSRQATDPIAPGVNPSSTFGWLRDLMARKPIIEHSPPAALVAKVKPSRSDLSAASPSMFAGATSRKESGQLEPLPMDPRSETSLINPSTSTPNVPPTTLTEASTTEFPFPTTNTGISIPTTAIPSLPSRASLTTSSGCSTTRDPDETVSLSYFGREPRRYRSDADVAHDDVDLDPVDIESDDEGDDADDPGDALEDDGDDLEDDGVDDFEHDFEDDIAGDGGDVEDGPDILDVAPDRPDIDFDFDVYNDDLFRDSLSVLAHDIEQNRATRRQEELEEKARQEEDDRGAARARQASQASQAARARHHKPPAESSGKKRLHFQEPLLPIATIDPPEPIKWTKGLTRGISRFFGRETKATPDLELGDRRIPYAQKGKQRAQPPPKQVKPPTPNLLQRLKSKPVPRETFLDMSSDQGSPFQLPSMPFVAGVTRKLSFRRQPQSPKSWLDMGPDPFAKIPVPFTEPAPPPSRLSTVYEKLGAATRAMTIKKRKETPIAPVYDPNLSKAERVLGADLSTYKSTQSYPDLLMPIPRRPEVQHSKDDLPAPDRPATSSGLRSLLRPAGFDLQPRPNLFAGNHPFYTAGLPPREPLANTAEQVGRDLGRWIKGLTRPSTADGTRRSSTERRPSWNRSTSDRRASVGSAAESIANRLERMVSSISSQLEPTPRSQPIPQPERLYPGGIDPIADPDLYEVVTRFEIHRKAEEERRRIEEDRGESGESDQELHISATSFPMPPTPRQAPARSSSLAHEAPTSPRYLSPNTMPRPGRASSPAQTLFFVPDIGGSVVELGPELASISPPNAPPTHALPTPAPAASPARVESSPGALAGFDALSPVHPSPLPIATPNVLGLSTAPSTATTGSRVSFAPSPPRHSHIDLKEFLLTSPSQIIRTTSAAELSRPIDNSPLIPEFPATYADLEPFIIAESSVWKRQDLDYSSSDDIEDLWPPSTPRYVWNRYRMVLTSAPRELEMDNRSYVIPADVESKVGIHLFKIRTRTRPATAPGSDTPSRNDPELTRRMVYSSTVVTTFQPYTVDFRESRRGYLWKDEDDEVDVTQICECIDGRSEHNWYLRLGSL